MDRKKILIAISAAGISLLTMTAGGLRPDAALTAAIGAARSTAYFTAGITFRGENTVEAPPFTEEEPEQTAGQAGTSEQSAESQPEESAALAAAVTADSTVSTPTAQESVESRARVISRNIAEFDDGVDRTAEGTESGVIVREHFGGYQGDDYIELPGGGLVWNCTLDSAESIIAAGSEPPQTGVERNTPEPQVLIIHTHTTESYEPYQRNYYDSSYPSRTRDSAHNVVRVGEALAQKLAENGISVLHDGTIHDYPSYTGSYDRSEETIRAALEEYPSIKMILDLHRDAISGGGVRTAPVSEIDGRYAAQFMVITGCDDGRFGNMPDYFSNLSLACAIQNSSEKLYPGLARPVLFDYRNYNQHISTGSLLIEIGSHANSIDEAVYTGELLGDIIAAAV